LAPDFDHAFDAYLRTQVRVTAAYRRTVAVQYTNGESHPVPYLEVVSITAT